MGACGAPRDQGQAHVALVTTWMALIVAALIAVLAPATYFALGARHYQGALEANADNLAFRLSELVTAHPMMWQFRFDLLNETLGRFRHHHGDDALQILVVNGNETVIRADPSAGPITPAWLAASASHPVFDSGRAIGRVELKVSLRPLAYQTLAVAALATALAAWAFAIFRLVPLRALERALNEAAYLARHDPLTGLPNRTMFRDQLAQALAEAERRETRVAVLCLDLDHFKEVNDTLGHAIGDRVLQAATERIGREIRRTDTLARLGGDSFAIIQTSLGQPDGAAQLAQRVTIGCSIGIAIYPHDETDPNHLLRNADLALYGTKTEGRGIYRFFEQDMNRRLQRRKLLESSLRRALTEDQLEMYYQPQIDLATRRVVGAEALVRWHDPERGVISPGEFVPLAERSGLILPITEWALRRSCREAIGWPGLSLAVNLSPVAFKHLDLVGLVRSVLEETGFDPRFLELEITETSLLHNTDQTLDMLRRLKALGVSVAMDDFGTGYSSLSYLQRFPFDKIKIDRSFVSEILDNEEAVAIVRAVLGMGQSLGMKIVAEGVETDQQAAFLAAEGCDEVQGFYFARPMPAVEMSSLMRRATDDAFRSRGAEPVLEAAC